MMLNNFFDKVFVITCEKFVERHSYIKNHFEKKKIEFEFLISVDKENLFDGEITKSEKSLALSHLNCVINSKLNEYKNILICEDDVNFVDDLDEKINSFLKIVPNDWHFLQLGNQFWATQWLRRKFISQNLYEFEWGTGSHCIGINSNVFDSIIQRFKKMDEPVDFMYYDLFSKHKCYCPESFLADALSKNSHLKYEDDKHVFVSSIEHKFQTI